MEGSRFDRLTRELATGTSRRRVLGGLAGGLLAVAGLRETDAACREAGRRCTGHGNCCSGVCNPATMTCACPPGAVTCRGACLDAIAYQSDPLNCGGCDVGCPAMANATATCASGTCGFACNQGFKLCGESCIQQGICCTAADCAAPSPGTCQGERTCSGGVCGFAPAEPGTVCGTGPSCTAGMAKGQDTCNETGDCMAGEAITCPSGACDGTTCRPPCPGDEECGLDGWCNGGRCVTAPDLFMLCEDDSDCSTGLCPPGRRCCTPDRVNCDGSCDQFCWEAPAHYRDRFEFCMENLGDCAVCAASMGCLGTIDTQTSCGTVTYDCR